MKLYFALSLFLFNLFFNCPVLADQFKSLESNRLYYDAYYMGRGDTGIADTDNSESIFYNPAAIASGKKFFKQFKIASPMLQASTGIQDFYSTIQSSESTDASSYVDYIGTPFTLGMNNLTALVFRRAAIGYLVSGTAKAIVYKDPDQGASEVITMEGIVNRAMTYSLAEQFFKGVLQVGTTVKIITQNYYLLEKLSISDATDIKDKLTDTLEEYSGYGVDVGMMLVSKHKHPLKLGITIKDIGDSTLTNKNDQPSRKLYQTLNVGFSAGAGTKFSELRFLLDYRDILNNVETSWSKKLHIGANLAYKNLFGLTAGINQGYPTGGIFMDIRFFRADLAYYASEQGTVSGERQDGRIVFRFEVKI